MSEKNIVVLGAGPGGYTAAFLAADLGMNVTLIDENLKAGGECLHRGCIPSKSLLHLSRLIEDTQNAEVCGLKFQRPEIDLNRIREWNREVINKMANGLSALCKQRGVKFLNGRAKFENGKSLIINGTDSISFDTCILATGSRPVFPTLFAEIENRTLTSTSALELQDIPGHLLVVGGGYIGLELGTVYSALGSRVTVVEMTGDLLTGVDRDLVRPLQARLKSQFQNILLNTEVTACNLYGEKVSVQFDGDKAADQFDRVLVAVGRTPNSEDLGLENTGVKINNCGFIQVDERFQTDEPSIFAIGDVIGGSMLAHKASAEGKAAVKYLTHGQFEGKSQCVPAVVFTDPEIAWCGMTETDAKNNNIKVQIAKFPWMASGRAQTLGRPEGMTKLILEPDTEQVLGMGITGVGAGELIGEGVLAVDNGLKAKDLANSIHPHPTLSETIMESAEVFYGEATHIYKKIRK